jgi:hypothetical protein
VRSFDHHLGWLRRQGQRRRRRSYRRHDQPGRYQQHGRHCHRQRRLVQQRQRRHVGGRHAVYTFDTATEGFKIQDSSAAAGVDPVPKADVMLSFNADDGSPDPGSLQLDIPYNAASQYVSTGVNLDPGIDLTGKKLKAMVKIVSGYGSEDDIMTAPGNAKLYVKTGATYLYASASVANITSIGTWVAIEFDPEFPGYQAEGEYDIKDVKEIGIQLDTNSASTTAAPAVVLIDSIAY